MYIKLTNPALGLKRLSGLFQKYLVHPLPAYRAQSVFGSENEQGHKLRRFSAWAVNNLQIGGALTRIILIVAHFCPDSDAEHQSITNYKRGDGGKCT